MKNDSHVTFNHTGVEKRIQELKNRVEGKVAMTDLFNEAFMVEHTAFPTIQAMVDASPLTGTPAEQMKEAIQRPEWSSFVSSNTRFPDWRTMLVTAGNEEMKRRLSPDPGEEGGD